MSFKNNYFEGADKLTPSEKKEMLNSYNVGIIDDHEYVKAFDESQIDELEEKLIELNKELVKVEDKLKGMSAPLRAVIKEAKESIKDITKKLTVGGELVRTTCYLIPNYEEEVMGLYDSEGFLITARPLTPRERQLHINSPKHFKLN
ncbi:hypothetical protein V6R21_20390 [Limibacter armeniacum]|uniref:hypothetical protein n=1 Tax=Limibacter armeniacum TaxID=466084 RepID=UPI002FE62705